ncbi:MAG: 23S rRNA (adenine(2503)-C(2))-methyltransferase RlmN [Coriobacteriia bacterium]|nr:23S rRNA (adenine(2503)-C(2))-methyltransferase RlmN [Coriobacteriia bacterium]
MGIGVSALDRSGLQEWLAEAGQPRFRTGQLVRWLYQRGVASYDDMTDLPAGLRETLADQLPLARPRLETREVSELDDTRRYLWRLADGTTVESVGLPAEGRLTVCFSTQAGCAMGCSFCATGKGRLVRDLGPGEMVDQVRLVGEDFGLRVTNAVAMGQGEPFANYGATLGGLRFMNDPDGLGIGARHLTVSTCGLVAGIERFASEPEQFTLAVSLHSAVQATRDRLMPALCTQPLPRLRAALQHYSEATGRRPSLEYALVDGLNDSAEELAALIGFCTGLLCHVNLIPVNPVGDSGHERPSDERMRAFLDGLTAASIQATVRTERGMDIEAACGQLTQRHAPEG